MAGRRKLIWQHLAQRDRKNIFSYWNERNKSNLYSKKLNKIFKEKTAALTERPYIGHPTDFENIRILVVEKYLIIYEVFDEEIVILRIFDGRDNPEKLEI